MNVYEKGIEELIIGEWDLDSAICYKTRDYCDTNSLTKSERLLVDDFVEYLIGYLFDKLKENCTEKRGVIGYD